MAYESPMEGPAAPPQATETQIVERRMLTKWWKISARPLDSLCGLNLQLQSEA